MLILLSPGFPKHESDTTCLPAIQKMMRSLADTVGPENLTIITLQYPFEASEYTWHNIKVIAIAGKNKKALLRFYTWYRAWKALHYIASAKKINGIIGLWLTETSFLAQWYGKWHKLKRIFWIQGQDVKKENRYISFIQPKADQVAAISNFSAQQFKKNYGISPHYLWKNGIYKPDFPELNSAERPIAVMGAGSLYALKNYELFVDVLQIVSQRFPNLKFIQVGEGPSDKKLKERAKSKGLSNSLQFMGNIPHAQVYVLMNQTKVFLHTSLFEGSSTVIAEALYLGCQVVSTIGLDETDPSNIVIGKNAQELAAAVIIALESESAPLRIMSHDLSKTSLEIAKAFGLQTL